MHTIKIKRKVSSPYLQISGLKNFIGKYVEITVKESPPVKKVKSGKLAAGILSAFKNSEKRNLEKEAWKSAVSEKYGNN